MKTRTVLVVLLAAACSSSPSETDGGTVPDSGQMQMSCSAMPGQSLGDVCCTKYGSSACTGNSFCAESTNGGQATCAANGTQPDMEPCTASIQCVSGGCNTTVGLCQSSPGNPCTATLGCGPSTNGVSPYSYCDPKSHTCTLSTGQCMSACVSDAGCAPGSTYCVGATASAAGECCYSDNCQPACPPP